VTEQPTTYLEDQAAEPADEHRSHRSLWTLTSVMLLLVIVALALLMLRGCSGLGVGLDDLGGKTIGAVDGADAVPGVISLWLEEPARLGDVLDSAGVTADSTVDLGEGRCLVVVGEGLEDSCADRIAAQAGVHDVGLVFEEDVER